MRTPRQGTNGKGETLKQGNIVTITTREGEKVSGEADFSGGSHQTTIVRTDSGYTYHGETRTAEKGNTTGWGD